MRKFHLARRGLSVTLVALGGCHLVTSFLLEGHAKNAITYTSPIQRVKGGAGLLLIQVHETEAATSARHDVRSQADRSDSTIIGEKPTQTFFGRARGQILYHHLCRHSKFFLGFEKSYQFQR
jgi:hypothetical protein